MFGHSFDCPGSILTFLRLSDSLSTGVSLILLTVSALFLRSGDASLITPITRVTALTTFHPPIISHIFCLHYDTAVRSTYTSSYLIMPCYTSSPVSVYTMDPNTGYLTHQFMRTATSSLSPATRDLPLLGKDAPALVEDIVLESGKIVYYMQLETIKTRADEDLRKRASRRGKRAIRAMERMVQDLEDALLQDDDAPRAEKYVPPRA